MPPIKISRVDIFIKRFTLAFPSAVAYETQADAPNTFLRMAGDNRISGWGCGAPDFEVTGETPDSVRDFLLDAAYPILMGGNPLDADSLMKKIRAAGNGKNPAACAAVSIALHDLMGKIEKIPVYAMLGGRPRPLATSYTISLLPLDAALDQARQALARGFKILKIKLGEGPEADAFRISELRSVAGEAVPFRLDANQAYTAEETLDLLRRIDIRNIEFIEQPTPKDNLAALKEVSAKSPIPVMADEPVLNARDAERIVSEKIAPLANIKLMKCGGLDEALRIDEICRAGGVGTMVGCMDESALSISAGLHVALALKSLRYIDLDGHMDIMDDAASGSPVLRDGCLLPLPRPGLGVEIDEIRFLL